MAGEGEGEAGEEEEKVEHEHEQVLVRLLSVERQVNFSGNDDLCLVYTAEL